ncbi:MAG: UDP-glucose/GDP-mannose dehydrogenase family protein [Proteobacteria bacterium]|nr:UDP-glucose/GDP-mannose dehydrogenase family protein [Pseudomonadota bacterium]
MISIGVIGNGFVGNAVANGFDPFLVDGAKVYDIDPKRRTHGLVGAINSDFVFVCLPTPMVDAEGGECNLSIIEEFFDTLNKDDLTGSNPVFIIKSTVPIGTTRKLQEKHTWLNIIHNPEFLTAANAEEDFLNADRTVLGGSCKESLSRVEALYEEFFPETPIYTMTSDESESVKYFANCFLATKVMFFNEMKMLSESLDVDFDKIGEAVTADSRIANTHWKVPGPDGEYGFGGTCFPKDTNALIYTMEKYGINPIILKAVWEQNKKLRKNWDWATNKSAVAIKENNQQ